MNLIRKISIYVPFKSVDEMMNELNEYMIELYALIYLFKICFAKIVYTT